MSAIVGQLGAPASLADREHWILQAEDLRERAAVVAAALGLRAGGREAASTRQEARLRPDLQRFLGHLAGGDPFLEWVVVLAAVGVTLRRLGAGRQVVVLTGTPLPGVLAPVPAQPTPVVLDPPASADFKRWLAETRSAALGAAAHDRFPSGTVERTLGDLPTLTVVHTGIYGEYDAPLTIGYDSRSSTLSLVHDDRLEDAVAHALLPAMLGWLSAAIAAPERAVGEHALLRPEDRAQVLERFNETWDVDRGASFRELVVRWARERPDDIAISDEREQISYRRLVARATGIAQVLGQHGIGSEQVVAVSCERTAGSVAAAVGVLFAGAAYMPVDPQVHPSRRAAMLARADAVIADDVAAARADGAARPLGLAALVAAADGRRPEIGTLKTAFSTLGPVPDEHHLAYCIFTSGSTGAPKGACVEHGAFLNNLAIKRVQFCLAPGVKVAQSAPVSFDVSIWQMFAALTAGAETVVVADEVALDMAAIVDRTVECLFPVLELVPTAIGALLEHLHRVPGDRARLEGALGALLSNGEALEPELAGRWLAEVPGVPLLNAWGPAECSDDVTEARITHAEVAVISIGRPLPSYRLYVLDRDLQPLPVGLPGEVHVGGASIGRGYLHEPGLTAAAFIPDPHATAGARMYRTGDRGRWCSDGELEFLGRIDNQVKLRGRRVELGEVEHVLRTLPGVGAAVALVRARAGRDLLVAFVVPETPGGDLSEVRAAAIRQLPDHLVPDEVVPIPRIPANRNGKVDRRALATAWDQASVEQVPTNAVAPRDDVERVLWEIWTELLAAPPLGVHDDFFALGGDSIINIQVTQRAAQRGVQIRPRAIFDHRTIAELAAVAAEGNAAVSLQSTSGPLTPIQRWFFNLGLEDKHHWNQSYCLEAEERLDPVTLAAALAAVVEHHTQLRVAFFGRDGELAQEVAEVPEGDELLWQVETAAAGRYRRVREEAHGSSAELSDHADALHASLSLTEGRLVRGLLIHGGDVPDRLLLTIHHLAVDRVSWSILIEDLTSAYRSMADGTEVRLPQRTSAYLDWARWLQTRKPTPPTDKLEAVEMPRLPRRNAVRNVLADARQNVFEIDADATRRLLSRAAEASEGGMQAVLLAGLARALEPLVGSGGAAVELEGHGRDDLTDAVDIVRTVGWFTVLGPVRLPAPAGDAVKTVEEVAERLADMRARRHLFEHMLGSYGRSATIDAVPADVSFNYMGRIDASAMSANGSLFRIAADLGQKCAPTSRRHVEWDINAAVVHNRLRVQLEYVPGRQDAAAVDSFVDDLRRFLLAFAGRPALGVSPAIDPVLPPTPTQATFIERLGGLEPQWNNAMLLTVRRPISDASLRTAVAELVQRHPALRTRLVSTRTGYHQGPDTGDPDPVPVTEVDLRDVRVERRASRVNEAATGLHRSLDPTTGPIGRVAIIRTPSDADDDLLLVFHHVVIDPLSWGVLIDELDEHLRTGAIARPMSTSIFEWTERLTAYATRDADRFQLAAWTEQPWAAAYDIAPGGGEPTAPREARIEVSLDRAATAQVAEAARRAQLSFYEQLLTLFGRSARQWPEMPAEVDDLLIELGGHGREDLFDDVDLSGTVGWFTTGFPFRLPVARGNDGEAHQSLTRARARAVPNRGFDFQVLRNLHPQRAVRDAIRAVPPPQLRFDYDGELHFLDAAPDDDASLLVDGRTEGTGEWKNADADREWLVDVIVSIVDGASQVQWQYSPRRIARARVERMALAFEDELRAAV